jgi:DNA-directed RNA polymerase subunit RPC12/RpoP
MNCYYCGKKIYIWSKKYEIHILYLKIRKEYICNDCKNIKI